MNQGTEVGEGSPARKDEGAFIEEANHGCTDDTSQGADTGELMRGVAACRSAAQRASSQYCSVLVLDDVVGDFFPETAAGSTGILCRITTNDAGTLGLELTLSDLNGETTESATTIETFSVEP